MNVVELVKEHPYASAAIGVGTFVLIWILFARGSASAPAPTVIDSTGNTAAAAGIAAAQIAANAQTAQAQIAAGAAISAAQIGADTDRTAIAAQERVSLAENSSMLSTALAQASALLGSSAYHAQSEIAASNNAASVAYSSNATAVQISENEVAKSEFNTLAGILSKFGEDNSIAGILKAFTPIATTQASVGRSDATQWNLLALLGGGSQQVYNSGQSISSTVSSGWSNTFGANGWGGWGANTQSGGNSYSTNVSNSSAVGSVTTDPSRATLSASAFTTLFNTLVAKLAPTQGAASSGVQTPSQATIDLAKANLGNLPTYSATH